MAEPRGSKVLSLWVKPLRDCFVFSGRSTRSEVVAFWVLTMFASGVVRQFPHGEPFGPPTPVEAAWSLLWAFPTIALSVRRYHDQGRSAWWLLVPAGAVSVFALTTLLPQQPGGGTLSVFAWHSHPAPSLLTALLDLLFVVFVIAMAVLDFAPPSPGTNRYGPDPRLLADVFPERDIQPAS